MIKPTILAIKILSIKLFSIFFGSSTSLNKLFYTCIWEAKNLIISIWLMLIWRICFFLRKKIDEKVIVLSKQNKNHKWWKCIFIGQNFFCLII